MRPRRVEAEAGPEDRRAVLITAGGSHHTCMTTSVGREAWEDFARIAGVELAVIDENTNARQFEKELELSEMYHRLNNRH